jgi:hypothetical protein
METTGKACGMETAELEGQIVPLMRRYELCAHALEMARGHAAECDKLFDEAAAALGLTREALHDRYRTEAQSATAAVVAE